MVKTLAKWSDIAALLTSPSVGRFIVCYTLPFTLLKYLFALKSLFAQTFINYLSNTSGRILLTWSLR